MKYPFFRMEWFSFLIAKNSKWYFFYIYISAQSNKLFLSFEEGNREISIHVTTEKNR